MIEPIPPARIPHEWNALGKELLRTKRYEPINLNNVFAELCTHRRQAWRVLGGFALTEIERIEGTLQHIFWITHVAGSVGLRKREKVRGVMDEFEEVARTGRHGKLYCVKCSELRAWPRKGWLRFLPDYSATPLGDGRFEIRKAL